MKKHPKYIYDDEGIEREIAAIDRDIRRGSRMATACIIIGATAFAVALYTIFYVIL